MSSKTINYGLNKPDYDDLVDIGQLNENAEIVDAVLKGIVDEVSTKETPAGAQAKADMAENNAKSYTDANLPTKVSQLENDKSYVTQSELGGAGFGDMMKSIYDANDNGKVDVAENAEKLGGQLPSYYENVANKGQANGYASLDNTKKVPISQLPSLGVEQAQFDEHIASLIPHGGVNFDTSLTYNASGEIVQVDVKQSNVLRVRTVLNYSNERLTSTNVKQYASDGVTVVSEYTNTIIYDGEDIVGIKRQVV